MEEAQGQIEEDRLEEEHAKHKECQEHQKREERDRKGLGESW